MLVEEVVVAAVVVLLVLDVEVVLAPVLTLLAAAEAQPARRRQANGNSHILKFFFMVLPPGSFWPLCFIKKEKPSFIGRRQKKVTKTFFDIQKGPLSRSEVIPHSELATTRHAR